MRIGIPLKAMPHKTWMIEDLLSADFGEYVEEGPIMEIQLGFRDTVELPMRITALDLKGNFPTTMVILYCK